MLLYKKSLIECCYTKIFIWVLLHKNFYIDIIIQKFLYRCHYTRIFVLMLLYKNFCIDVIINLYNQIYIKFSQLIFIVYRLSVINYRSSIYIIFYGNVVGPILWYIWRYIIWIVGIYC